MKPLASGARVDSQRLTTSAVRGWVPLVPQWQRTEDRENWLFPLSSSGAYVGCSPCKLVPSLCYSLSIS